MEQEEGAISQLGDLALGDVLSQLGVDAKLPVQGLGAFGGPAAKRNVPPAGVDAADGHLDRAQIYADKYADDDDEDDDLLAEARRRRVEEEGGEDSRGVAGTGARPEAPADLDRYLAMGMKSVRAAQLNGHVRGEESFSDEDAPAAQKVTVKREEDEAMSDDEERRQRQLLLQPRPPPPTKHVNDIWPEFRADAVLNFTEMFGPRSTKRRRLGDRGVKLRLRPGANVPSTRTDITRVDPDGRKRPGYVDFVVADTLRAGKGDAAASDEEWEASLRAGRQETRPYEMVELDEWEDRIEWGDEASARRGATPPSVDRPHIRQTYNQELAGGAWVDGIIWAPGALHRAFDGLTLDLNDPDMMLERVNHEAQEKVTSLVRVNAPAISARAARQMAELDPLNLSNDRFYEMTKQQRNRIRQTLGRLEVRHAWPAVKLQLPFYKTTLTKAEARSFHRPAISFPANIPLRFSKVRSSKKKRDEASGGGGGGKSTKDPIEALRSTRDLTLKDTSPFVLYEYSEEYPNVLSNLGMGSLIVNYYRKRDNKDEHVPKYDLGETYALEPTDESPFMKFGSIHSGQTQPTLYNNLIRAPLFRHKATPTDFLFIRSTTKTEVRYYLREIKNLFVVGQTYPVVQVPGPHARLVTNMIKHRLFLITNRLLQAYNGRLKIHRIMRYFTDQNELQMRQRLKEFMEYTRQAGAKDQGYWKLRPGAHLPEESELHKLLPPEHICLIEAMQAGQRRLLDAGYTKTAEGADEDADESTMDVEQLLAPWITSKNFLHASQAKAMLKLHGEGDPTGRGEAFSLLRVSMKEVFFKAGEDIEARLAEQAEEERRSGHRYNVAKQQRVYRSEVERIWNAQKRALSNPVPPHLTAEDEARHRASVATPGAPASAAPDDGESQIGNDDRVLRIRRLVHGRWETELVREPAVIHAYVKQRQRIEDEAIATEALVPTGDAALDAARRKRLAEELALAKKNQERRLQRKNAKAVAEGREIPGGLRKLANKTGTKRVCGRCGEVGHMMTNTACPLYQAGATARQIESSASSRKTAHTATAKRPSVASAGAGGGATPVPQTPLTPSTPLSYGASPFPGAPTPGTPRSATHAASPPLVGATGAGTAKPAGGQAKVKLKLGKKT